MSNPDYCTRPGCSCWVCPYQANGLDCRSKSIAHRLAGSVVSERKAASSRANGKRGGRPRKVSF